MKNDMTDIDVIDQVLYTGNCRINKKTAQRFLFENKSWVVGGTVRYFCIEHIGLDVYEIRLADETIKNTFLNYKL